MLAGGGHSHALLLRRWAMHPRHRPKGLITLVNRSSTTLYSGMVPGLIAGLYSRDQVAIDLRRLAADAGVAFVEAEIQGLELTGQTLRLASRPPLPFTQLSLDVGAISRPITTDQCLPAAGWVPIKPLEPALAFLDSQDANSSEPFHVLGSGLAGVEVALALRQRWPQRPIHLLARQGRLDQHLDQALQDADVSIVHQPAGAPAAHALATISAGLICSGTRAPGWLAASGLHCCPQSGRVLTNNQLQVIEHPNIFASGDCGLIGTDRRPPSGVWAVRAAIPLGRNLKAACQNQPLRRWTPQRKALQLLGGFQAGRPTAWALWGSIVLGPHPLLWHWKQRIDRRFMQHFRPSAMSKTQASADGDPMLCRGCAAKLPAATLEAALSSAGVGGLATAPEDAAVIPTDALGQKTPLLQSVDGFPALVSDPWLNGRLTALHACSDLWACGACVQSAQAVITLPLAPASIQQQLLAQTISGIRSALVPQKAMLIGGHTLEDRNPAPDPCSLGLQLALTVQGSPRRNLWPKRALQAGDQLLLSRPLGTGVLFAAAMTGAARPEDLDTALCQMQTSQHSMVEQLSALEQHHPGHLHAATDITGFGLLGHLGEMLGDTAKDRERLQVQLDANRIPALPGALALLAAGYTSSLAPANRRAWSLLDAPASAKQPAPVGLHLAQQKADHKHHRALLELLIDPQTCGPLLISVTPTFAADLLSQPGHSWHTIGRVSQLPMN
ncbi:selenide, water dikinase SelD [Synechococcus sp. N5]|uniref:selenide, water dikinase SelD n=1 Tax=Synechococcus sp. N5 TaxID=2575515 RepID=UPI000E0EE388|nr:selenide, water dikinase SelD [Synechococcus sp. N5]